MEFSTKMNPTTPEKEDGGVVVRDPHTLYNKNLQFGQIYSFHNKNWEYKGWSWSVIDDENIKVIEYYERKR